MDRREPRGAVHLDEARQEPIVGLLDARDMVPGLLSGGMRKRLGVSRATVHENHG